MKEFRLTRDHITLLKNMIVGWQDCETGAPEINPKRPYGNSGVAEDIARILGWSECFSEDGEFDSEDDEWTIDALNLHAETETALQIVLSTGKFKPGEYIADDYRTNWRRKP